MATDRLILCGRVSAAHPPIPDAHPVTLDIYGSNGNVNLRLEDVRRALWTDIPPSLRDLLDLAVYVFCADQATTRANGGRVDGQEIGRGWRRRLYFRVAVREPELWAGLQDQLVSVLSFLSEDEYHFEFVKLARDRSLDGFINFEETPFDGHVQEVVLFSGGLDSLAGAVQESLVDKRQILLVNHRSTSKRATRHERLVADLNTRAGRLAPLHFPVWANKQKSLTREYTQRTRSFLFAALGGLFAAMLGLNRVRFYENGVVSLNLPLSAQVVGARASRTTHPRVLDGFGRLLTALLGRQFTFENPFLWKTKTDVVELVRDANCGDLVACSTSCGHTWELTNEHTHCGVCSQCIDRRLAVVAARLEMHDPAAAYKTNPLVGSPPDLAAKTMLVAFMELVERVEVMTAAEFLGHFGEVARVLRHHAGGADEAAQRVYRLYRKHASQVRSAINRATAERINEVTRRTLPRDCLLRLVYEGGDTETNQETPPQPPQPPRPEGNSFVRRGQYWAIRFGAGDENYYKAELGFDYLRVLFEHPRKTFQAAELAVQVGRQHTTDQPRTASVGEAAEAGVGMLVVASADVALDELGLIKLITRLQQIEERREVVQESDSATRVDELDDLDAEERGIRTQLNRDRGLGGKARTLGDLRNRIRNRVCNAVKRALKQIDKYDKSLAAHLKAPILTLGHSLRYQSDATMTWQFSGEQFRE